MLEAPDRYTGQAAGIDKASMGQRVKQDAVLRREQSREHGQIREVSGAERDRRCRALKCRQFSFHLMVKVYGPGEQAHSSSTGAVLVDSLDGRTIQPLVADQAQVVVRRKHQ